MPLEKQRSKTVFGDADDGTPMDAMLKLEEVGVNEPLDEAGAMFSYFDPAALGGKPSASRQRRGSIVPRRPPAPG